MNVSPYAVPKNARSSDSVALAYASKNSLIALLASAMVPWVHDRISCQLRMSVERPQLNRGAARSRAPSAPVAVRGVRKWTTANAAPLVQAGKKAAHFTEYVSFI